jgi:Tfp pilus assembly protein FimV
MSGGAAWAGKKQSGASRHAQAHPPSREELQRQVERQQREIEKLRKRVAERDQQIADAEKQGSASSASSPLISATKIPAAPTTKRQAGSRSGARAGDCATWLM